MKLCSAMPLQLHSIKKQYSSSGNSEENANIPVNFSISMGSFLGIKLVKEETSTVLQSSVFSAFKQITDRALTASLV